MLLAKYRRLELKYSTHEVAALAGSGLTQPQVTLIENGRLKPSAAQLAKLAHVLRVSTPVALLDEVRLIEAQHAALQEVTA